MLLSRSSNLLHFMKIITNFFYYLITQITIELSFKKITIELYLLMSFKKKKLWSFVMDEWSKNYSLNKLKKLWSFVRSDWSLIRQIIKSNVITNIEAIIGGQRGSTEEDKSK